MTCTFSMVVGNMSQYIIPMITTGYLPSNSFNRFLNLWAHLLLLCSRCTRHAFCKLNIFWIIEALWKRNSNLDALMDLLTDNLSIKLQIKARIHLWLS